MADLKVKVGVDKSGFTTGLASMENSVKGFGTKVGGILAGAFAFDKIIQGFSTAIEKGDQLQDLANRFGIAASSIQEIGNAASLSGAGIEDVASAMNKLAKNAGEAVGGNDAMAEAFAKIGLSVADLNGMSPQDLFMALSKAVASGSLGMQDFAVAMQLAGKGAGALMETLRMGPDAIAANGQAMGVFSDETIKQLSEASDAMKSFSNMITVALGNIAAFGSKAVPVFQSIVEQLTLMAVVSGKALTGNFAEAAAIYKAQMHELFGKDGKSPAGSPAAPTPRNMGDDFDTESSRKSSSSANKAAEIEKNKLKSAEDKLADAVRDRETLSMNSAQKLGRAQAELVKLKMDELAIADKTIEKLNAQEGIERKKIEVLELQKDVNAEIQDAEKDFMRAAKSNDLDGMQEANERGKRLQEQNKARGNAADFDPRQALMDKDVTIKPTIEMPTLPEVDLAIKPQFEMPTLPEVADLTKMQPVPKQEFLGVQLRDIPSSTEAQRTQPVRLENPPNLQGVIDRLDRLIANAGVFS